MERKKAPHKLQVEDSKQDDNSIVEMTQAKMDELKIFKGDAVILKGKHFLSFLILSPTLQAKKSQNVSNTPSLTILEMKSVSFINTSI